MGDNHLQPPQNATTPPANYICPLTLQIMDEPVIDTCGHCFERTAVIEWLEYHEMCPISRKPLHLQELIPSDDLKTRIQKWRADHPGFREDTEDMYSISDHESHSQFELMLLPQERDVLRIIKIRAKDRRHRQEFTKCLWIIAIVATLFLFIATCLALFLMDVRLRGPI